MKRVQEVVPCEDDEGMRYEVTLWREWHVRRKLGGSREVAGHVLAALEGPHGSRRLDILSAYDEFRFRDTGQDVRRRPATPES